MLIFDTVGLPYVATCTHESIKTLAGIMQYNCRAKISAASADSEAVSK